MAEAFLTMVVPTAVYIHTPHGCGTFARALRAPPMTLKALHCTSSPIELVRCHRLYKPLQNACRSMRTQYPSRSALSKAQMVGFDQTVSMTCQRRSETVVRSSTILLPRRASRSLDVRGIAVRTSGRISARF